MSFALHDKRNRQLWLVRDRAGKKPLYYCHKGDEWYFASELNAIRGSVNLEMRMEHVYEYLRMGTFYRSHTPYKKVYEHFGITAQALVEAVQRRLA